MEAMILAAGLGTRLRPLTDEIPKALIEVGRRPVLEHVARRLIDAGADRLVVNVHHHADRIRAFLSEKDDFGVEVAVSEEADRPLETGGGLKQAAPLFRKDGPFFMHNADILTDLDLKALYEDHLASGALATLAVRPRETQRYLVFDGDGLLCGYSDREGKEHLMHPPAGVAERVDFCGVQVLSPRIFDLMTETGVFSIINVYMRLARQGALIRRHRVGAARWIDIGTPERLEEAQHVFGTTSFGTT